MISILIFLFSSSNAKDCPIKDAVTVSPDAKCRLGRGYKNIIPHDTTCSLYCFDEKTTRPTYEHLSCYDSVLYNPNNQMVSEESIKCEIRPSDDPTINRCMVFNFYRDNYAGNCSGAKYYDEGDICEIKCGNGYHNVDYDAVYVRCKGSYFYYSLDHFPKEKQFFGTTEEFHHIFMCYKGCRVTTSFEKESKMKHHSCLDREGKYTDAYKADVPIGSVCRVYCEDDERNFYLECEEDGNFYYHSDGLIFDKKTQICAQSFCHNTYYGENEAGNCTHIEHIKLGTRCEKKCDRDTSKYNPDTIVPPVTCTEKNLVYDNGTVYRQDDQLFCRSEKSCAPVDLEKDHRWTNCSHLTFVANRGVCEVFCEDGYTKKSDKTHLAVCHGSEWYVSNSQKAVVTINFQCEKSLLF